MNNHALRQSVYERIETINNSESTTRKELAIISRDILTYVMDTDDIDTVNRLIGVLTRHNAKAAIAYFKHLLPWEVITDDDKVFQRFGKRTKSDKKLLKKTTLIREWLADEKNNIWNADFAQLEVKQKDFSARIQKAVKAALAGDEKTDSPAISKEAVLQAVFEGGVSINDVLAIMQDLAARQQDNMVVDGEAHEVLPVPAIAA